MTTSTACSRPRRRQRARPGRAVLHALPTGFCARRRDAACAIRKRHGRRRARRRHACRRPATRRAARNLMLAVERCHLRGRGGGRHALRCGPLDARRRRSGTRRGARRSGRRHRPPIGVFAGGRLVHADAVAVGGNHVTMDVARGLSDERSRDAERLKTLYGSCIAIASDDRETIAVPRGRRRHGSSAAICRNRELVRIISPRVEEILELVRDRLTTAGLAPTRAAARADRRRGQLTGLPELARAHHCRTRSASAGRSASRACPNRPRARLSRPRSDCWSIRRSRASNISSRAGGGGCGAAGDDGYFARVGRWLKESF